jgi:hypothetical protein
VPSVCSGLTQDSGYAVCSRPPLLYLPVEPVEQREVLVTAVADHKRGDPAAFFQILEA